MAGTAINNRMADIEYCPDFLNGYEILSELPVRGSQARAYRASKAGEDYVVKIYGYSLSDDMKNILETVKSIRSIALAQVVEYGESEGHAYEIQKYYPSEPFEKSLPYLVSHIIPRLNSALYELHSRNIVHMDIRPENIIFGGREVYLTDFGVCAFIDGKQMGRSPEYSSPEADREDNISEKSDYYSLGITIYTLLKGYDPFDVKGVGLNGDANADQKRITLLKHNPEYWLPIENMDPQLRKLIKNLTAPNAEARWGYTEVNEWINVNNSREYAKMLRQMSTERGQSIVSYEGRSYYPNEFGEMLSGFIMMGEEACEALFSYEISESVKLSDPYLAACIAVNSDDAALDSIAAAIAVKCSYMADLRPSAIGKSWSSVKKLGMELLELVKDVFDNIIYENESCYYKDECNAVNVFNIHSELWDLLRRDAVRHYAQAYDPTDSREYYDKRSVVKALEIVSDNIANMSSTDEGLKFFGCDWVCTGKFTGICYNRTVHTVLCNLAYAGFMLSGERGPIFGERYASLTDFYDRMLVILNSDPERSDFYARYINSYAETENGREVLLQPMLYALVRINKEEADRRSFL